MNSTLNESLIYAVKRTVNRVSVIANDTVSLNISNIDDVHSIPEAERIREQIQNNFQCYGTSASYVERLKKLFPHLPKLIELLLEEKYMVENTINQIFESVGHLVDFSEKGPTFFYFGSKYEEANGPTTDDVKWREYIHGSTGTEFSTAAQLLLYYNKGKYPRREQKTEGDLISLLNEEYYLLDCAITGIRNLLGALEAIQGTIIEAEQLLQQTAAETEIEPEQNITKRPPHKEQIILLHKLGILDLPIISNMDADKKGILIGRILGYDAKNSEDFIRYIGTKDSKNPYNVSKFSYEENVIQFLRGLGIEPSGEKQ